MDDIVEGHPVRGALPRQFSRTAHISQAAQRMFGRAAGDPIRPVAQPDEISAEIIQRALILDWPDGVVQIQRGAQDAAQQDVANFPIMLAGILGSANV